QIGEALPEVKYTLLTPTNKGLFLTFGGWIYLTENKKWELYTKPYFEAGSYMPLVEVSSESYKNNAGIWSYMKLKSGYTSFQVGNERWVQFGKVYDWYDTNSAGRMVFAGPAYNLSVPAGKYAVVVTDDGNGSAYSDKTIAAESETVNLTTKPKSGYIFDSWRIEHGSVSNLTDSSFRMGNENVKLRACFKPKYEYAGEVSEVFAKSAYLDPLIGEKIGRPSFTLESPTDKGVEIGDVYWWKKNENGKYIKCNPTSLVEDATYQLRVRLYTRSDGPGLCLYYKLADDTRFCVNNRYWSIVQGLRDYYATSGYGYVDMAGPDIKAVDARVLSGKVAYISDVVLGQPVSVTLTGEMYTATSGYGKKASYTWQRSDSADGPWENIEGFEDLDQSSYHYTPTAEDVNKYIRVSVSIETYIGSIASEPRLIERLANKDMPEYPNLETAPPYATVTVKNAKTSQEYVILESDTTGISISPSDWENSISPDSDGELALACTGTKDYAYVYTRFKETPVFSTGEAVNCASVATGGATALNGVVLDKKSADMSVGNVVPLTVNPIPANPYKFDYVTWSVDDIGGIPNDKIKLYIDEECNTVYNHDILAHQTIHTVYVKAEKPNYISTVRVLTSGLTPFSSECRIMTTDENGQIPMDTLHIANITTRPGDIAYLEYGAYPPNGKIGDFTINNATGTTLDIDFAKSDDGNYLIAEIPNAENGDYYYEAEYTGLEYGVETVKKESFCVTIDDSLPTVNNIEISLDSYTAKQGETFKLSAFVNSVTADEEVNWSVSDTESAYVSNTGSVTVRPNAKEGRSFDVIARAGAKIAVCKVKVYNEKSVTVQGSFSEDNGAGEYMPGDTVNIKAGVSFNMVFDGWESDDIDVWYDDISPEASFRMPEKNVTVKAIWKIIGIDTGEFIEYYTVSFNMCGKEAVNVPERQAVSKNSLAARPETDPSAEGFEFTGWYEDEACTEEFDFDNTPIVQDTTVYAGWKDVVEKEENDKTDDTDILPLPGEPEEDDSVWNLFEDASEHRYSVSGISSETEVKNSNSKSSKFFDAVLKGSEITVKLTGDRKSAAKAANTVLEFNLGDKGVLEYTLPVQYVKPVFRLAKSSVPIVGGKVYTKILKKTGTGSFVPYNAGKDSVNISGGGNISVSVNGAVSANVASKGKYTISLKKDGWESAIELKLKATAAKDLWVETGDVKTIILNTHAIEQKYEFDCYANGVPAAAGSVQIADKKNSGLVKVENGKVIVGFPAGGLKKGNYNITLSVGKAKQKLKIKVSDKELKNSVSFKVLSKYDVVTGSSMILKPVFKEAGGRVSAVSVNNAGYSAGVNAAGDIVVAYSGNDLSAKKLKIGSLDFKLKLEGINATVETTAVKLKAAKSSPKVKAASVKLLEESVSGNTVIQSVYKDRSGKLRNLEPVNIEIKPTSKLEASFDPADKMLISVKELKANKGSVTLKISYRGGVTKKLVIKVKKAK
nr:InlB B-repeat-containing protein [Lachnospiraceae bacterium]